MLIFVLIGVLGTVNIFSKDTSKDTGSMNGSVNIDIPIYGDVPGIDLSNFFNPNFGQGGAGSGLPSSLAIKCRTSFDSALETVAGLWLGLRSAKNQETYITRSFDYGETELMYESQKSDRIMGVCETNPQTCGIVASLDSNGSNYVAGMVAMQGNNNMMSPYNQSYGITAEAMQRNMMMQNPFMMGGYGNYYGATGGTGDTYGGRGNTLG